MHAVHERPVLRIFLFCLTGVAVQTPTGDFTGAIQQINELRLTCWGKMYIHNV